MIPYDNTLAQSGAIAYCISIWSRTEVFPQVVSCMVFMRTWCRVNEQKCHGSHSDLVWPQIHNAAVLSLRLNLFVQSSDIWLRDFYLRRACWGQAEPKAVCHTCLHFSGMKSSFGNHYALVWYHLPRLSFQSVPSNWEESKKYWIVMLLHHCSQHALPFWLGCSLHVYVWRDYDSATGFLDVIWVSSKCRSQGPYKDLTKHVKGSQC